MNIHANYYIYSYTYISDILWKIQSVFSNEINNRNLVEMVRIIYHQDMWYKHTCNMKTKTPVNSSTIFLSARLEKQIFKQNIFRSAYFLTI